MKKLGWGLLGCGDVATRRVAPALRALRVCDLVAVSRARSDLAEEFARRFGARRWYRFWEDLLADEEIQAVYVATPPDLHVQQTVSAAEAGKHVLCEKPMALDPDGCRRMIDACSASGVRLGIAYYRHFYPVIWRMREIVEAGLIGTVVFAEIRAFDPFRPGPDHPQHWITQRRRIGGGPLMDFGCHRIEVVLNVLGPIELGAGVQRNVTTDWEVEDTNAALLHLHGGAVGILMLTRAAQERADAFYVFGSEGTLRVEALDRGELRISCGDQERTEKLPPHPNPHLPCIEAFTDAVLNGRSVPVSGEVGLRVAELVEQIYRR